jgi:hypothetical protein
LLGQVALVVLLREFLLGGIAHLALLVHHMQDAVSSRPDHERSIVADHLQDAGIQLFEHASIHQ